MNTQDELPAWLTELLDKPLVGPVALVLVVAVAVLVVTWAITEWNRHVDRELERHRLQAKIARPETEFESAASHWHKPPVQAWGDEPREVRK